MNPSEARELAAMLHAGQADKAGQPYLGHLLRVSASVAARDGNAAAQIAALLHDAVEDGRATLQDLADHGVPADALALVKILTRTPSQPYAAYLSAICANPDALLVKLCDIADNSDPERLAMLPPDVADRLRTKYAKAMEILMADSAPAKKARGRPKKAPDEVASEMIHIRATVAEKAKYLELGGAKWFADVLKRARVSRSK